MLYALVLWNLLTPAMRMRSHRSGPKQGLFSAGGILLTLSFLMSLITHVVIVVALGYHSVFLTTVPLLFTATVFFMTKSYVDREFRTWKIGPKITHCLISAIFPITTPRPISGTDGNTREETTTSVRVKMSGGELSFSYLLHGIALLLGIMAFTLLNLDSEYGKKMAKLEEVSTISMQFMVYMVCPVAFLLSMLSQMIYRRFFDSWRSLRNRIRPGCCVIASCQDCTARPITTYESVPLTNSTIQRQNYEIPDISQLDDIFLS